MAAEFGFVYVLRNERMRGVFKIGMTDRSPRARCEELSGSTSVPQRFEVMWAAEVQGARDFELYLHKQFAMCRVSESREFFELDTSELEHLRALLFWKANACDGGFMNVMGDDHMEDERLEQELRFPVSHFVMQSHDAVAWKTTGRYLYATPEDDDFPDDIPF